MILTGAMLLAVVAAIVVVGVVLKAQLGLSLAQGVLYAPLKLIWRVDDRNIGIARDAPAPVIYAVAHQSRLDPALMLSLLPEQTLHILDEDSARSIWLEPYREMARTIAFNAEHVFVSRRLVRHLRGKGRLAVYFPDAVEPDTKAFRLYRAVARIAVKADARIVPVVVGGARHLPMSLTPEGQAPRRWLEPLSLGILEPLTLGELVDRAGRQWSTAAMALFDRIAEARVAATDPTRTLFTAIRDAALRFGPERDIVEDVDQPGTMSYRRLLIAARVLGRRFAAMDQPGEAVGLMLPNANGVAIAFLALQSAGRVAAMINYTAGPANVAAAVRTGHHAHGDLVAGLRREGRSRRGRRGDRRGRRAGSSGWRISATASRWRRRRWGRSPGSWPLVRREANQPAVLLFTSGSEGLPKGVVLSHRNILANALQAEARLTLTPQDKLLNVLPVFHSFGLTAGTVLPLLIGVRLFLYPSPLHYKLIPEVAAKAKPTILVGTDTFLNGYARTAKDSDFQSLRLVVAGAEAVKAETRRIWRERFGAEIVEGFGMTEAAPVVAVNTAIHGRDGTVGRLLPGMRLKLEPVDGISDGGRLFLSGPNVMLGYMTPTVRASCRRLPTAGTTPATSCRSTARGSSPFAAGPSGSPRSAARWCRSARSRCWCSRCGQKSIMRPSPFPTSERASESSWSPRRSRPTPRRCANSARSRAPTS